MVSAPTVHSLYRILAEHMGEALTPVCSHPSGVVWDFKYGARVIVPRHFSDWKVRMIDLDRDALVVKEEHKGEVPAPVDGSTPPIGTLVMSNCKYYVRWRLEVEEKGEIVVRHDFDAKDRDVMICVPNGLGDTLAHMKAIMAFQRMTKCKLTVQMVKSFVPLFDGHRDYAGVRFVNYEDNADIQAQVPFYAGYAVGYFYGPDRLNYEPYRHNSMPNIDKSFLYLNVWPPDRKPPRVNVEPGGPPCKGKYICVAMHATTQCKMWHYPGGWEIVLSYLKDQGYTLYRIDDYDTPLVRRARLLRHCEFLVGLTGGISWLAWALGKPVVAISGFSSPSTNFDNPYHVNNPHVCNSCWNDIQFDTDDQRFCPRHKDTPRMWECSTKITPTAVVQMIERVREDLRKRR